MGIVVREESSNHQIVKLKILFWISFNNISIKFVEYITNYNNALVQFPLYVIYVVDRSIFKCISEI